MQKIFVTFDHHKNLQIENSIETDQYKSDTFKSALEMPRGFLIVESLKPLLGTIKSYNLFNLKVLDCIRDIFKAFSTFQKISGHGITLLLTFVDAALGKCWVPLRI